MLTAFQATGKATLSNNQAHTFTYSGFHAYFNSTR